MKRNKILALLLASFMAVGCLTGCGNEEVSGKESNTSESKAESVTSSESVPAVEEKLYYNKDGWYPICDEEITITVSGITGTSKDWSNTLMVQTIKDEMGINMDITTHDHTIWSTQLALMMAEDNMPDLVLNGSWDKAQSNIAGSEGYLLNLAEYLDIMPNFASFLEENPAYKAYTMTENGEIFGIAGVSAARSANNRNAIFVSYADMEKYGFSAEDITTTEGFYDVLKKIKEQDPDRIPFGLTIDQYCANEAELVFRSAFGIYSTARNLATGVEDDGKVFLYETTENYKEYLKYMNRLYKEGLIENDAFVLTTDEYQSKSRASDYVFFQSENGLMNAVGAENSSVGRDYFYMSGLKSDLVDKSVYVYSNLVSSGTSIWVSADTEYPEAICRLIDYLFTDEGYLFFSFGVEGKSYVLEDDGFGNMVPNDSALFDASKVPYENKSQWKWQANVIMGAGTAFKRHPRDMFITNATDAELEKAINGDVLSYIDYALNERSVRQTCDEYVYTMPSLVYTDTEAGSRAALKTDLETYIKTMKAQFIRGEVDVDSEWDNFVKKLDEIGLKDFLSIEQAAYDRYKVNLE